MASVGDVAGLAPAKPRGTGVLIIVENLPVPFDRRVWSEARALRAAGYTVSVICPRTDEAPAAYEFIEGIHIYRHPSFEAGRSLTYPLEYANALFWEFVLSLKVLRRTGFDVIHACNPPDLIFVIGAFYKYLFGKRFIFDHHDLNPELYEAKFGRRGFLWKVLVLAERLTFKVADVSIATNESYRRIAIARGGMDPARVFTVRSGPDLGRVRPVAPNPRWKNGRTHMAAYVGVVGESEGLDLLLAAVDHIVRKMGRTDIQFVVMGSGPHWAEIRRLATEMNLDDYVTLTGRVDDATLMEALSTADIGVNPDRPSPMNDLSTMNKVMEYMALGKPMVQFDMTEGRVSAGESSLYARNTDCSDFGEKIVALMNDPGLRRRMGEAGQKRVREELAWPNEEPKLLAAYAAALKAKSLA
jgi:glycosyltransferase involved in cell wall biosynthesis